jgi:hypothetical protein
MNRGGQRVANGGAARASHRCVRYVEGQHVIKDHGSVSGAEALDQIVVAGAVAGLFRQVAEPAGHHPNPYLGDVGLCPGLRRDLELVELVGQLASGIGEGLVNLEFYALGKGV